MRLPWSARQYERTCADCGYAWPVPGQFAHKNVASVWGATSGLRSRSIGGQPRPISRRAWRSLSKRHPSARVPSAVQSSIRSVLSGPEQMREGRQGSRKPTLCIRARVDGWRPARRTGWRCAGRDAWEHRAGVTTELTRRIPAEAKRGPVGTSRDEVGTRAGHVKGLRLVRQPRSKRSP